MSISNTGMGTVSEAPAEPFKRAITGELDVALAAAKPALTPDRVRLPPSRRAV